MDRRTNGEMDRSTKGEMDHSTKGEMDVSTDGEMNHSTKGKMNRHTNGEMERSTKGEIASDFWEIQGSLGFVEPLESYPWRTCEIRWDSLRIPWISTSADRPLGHLLTVLRISRNFTEFM